MTPKTVLDSFCLDGRVALITGGAGLLGKKHAEAVTQAGGSVVLVDINLAAAVKAAKDLKKQSGQEVTGLRADISVPSQVSRLIRQVLKRFGKIDILINNAAMTVKQGAKGTKGYFAPFENYPVQLWKKALDINLTGMFLVTQAVGKVMKRQKQGVILNIASTAAVAAPDHRIYKGVRDPYSGNPFNTPIAYSATKAGVLGFTRYLATYWAQDNIRVNALSPGGVFDGHESRFVRQYSQRVPLNRMADQDEYKGAVLFLVSDASSYMTGENMIVDGGLTAW